MAKMFYTLDEAAEKLGMSPDDVKELAASGQLQQFRDGKKLLFKRDQIDAAASGGSNGGSSLSLSDDPGTMGLKSDDTAHSDDPRDATGVSVFDADEVEAADPAAQTQVTQTRIDDDLALESVGSGSGLLDLTRDSDDTSLGAELLDEIYPGSGGGDTAGDSATAVGSSGVFDSAMASGTGMPAAASGLQSLQTPTTAAQQPATLAVSYEEDSDDPAGNGFCAGMLLGASVALVMAFIVATAHVLGASSVITGLMYDSSSSMTLLMWSGGLLVGSVVLGVLGMAIGKATAS